MQSMHMLNFESHIQLTMRKNSKQLQRASEENLLQDLNVVLGQSTESLCGYTNHQQTSVPRLDAAKPNSFVAASTSLDSTAKQFAIPEENF